MKIAIPVANEKLCMHFGHCEQFAILEVDEKEKKIVNKDMKTPPPHEPGVIPRWVGQEGVDLVIAGGMGKKAQEIFNANGVKVLVGAPVGSPEEIVMAYLNGTLTTGANACDH